MENFVCKSFVPSCCSREYQAHGASVHTHIHGNELSNNCMLFNDHDKNVPLASSRSGCKSGACALRMLVQERYNESTGSD
jgi:hypothetical protein